MSIPVTKDLINNALSLNQLQEALQLCQQYFDENISEEHEYEENSDIDDVFIHYIRVCSELNLSQEGQEMFSKLYSEPKNATINVAITYINFMIYIDKTEETINFISEYLHGLAEEEHDEEKTNSIIQILDILKGMKLDNTELSTQIDELLENLQQDTWKEAIALKIKEIINITVCNVYEEHHDSSSFQQQDSLPENSTSSQLIKIDFFTLMFQSVWNKFCDIWVFIKEVFISKQPSRSDIIMIGCGVAALIGGIYSIRKFKNKGNFF
ncbi:Uncharacterized protein QTN25_005501 [Entamoeba marina]